MPLYGYNKFVFSLLTSSLVWLNGLFPCSFVRRKKPHLWTTTVIQEHILAKLAFTKRAWELVAENTSVTVFDDCSCLLTHRLIYPEFLITLWCSSGPWWCEAHRAGVCGLSPVMSAWSFPSHWLSQWHLNGAILVKALLPCGIRLLSERYGQWCVTRASWSLGGFFRVWPFGLYPNEMNAWAAFGQQWCLQQKS